MAIGSDDEVSCGHDSLLGKEGVFDAHAAHIEEVDDIVLFGKLLAYFALLGALDIFVRSEVVEDQGYLFAVEHLVHVRLFKFANGDRSGDIVCERKIDIRLYELARFHRFKPGVRGKNLLRHGHFHGNPYLLGIVHRRVISERLAHPSVDCGYEPEDGCRDNVVVFANAPGDCTVFVVYSHVGGCAAIGSRFKSVLAIGCDVRPYAELRKRVAYGVEASVSVADGVLFLAASFHGEERLEGLVFGIAGEVEIEQFQSRCVVDERFVEYIVDLCGREIPLWAWSEASLLA